MKIVFIGDSLTFGYGVEKRYRWIELFKENSNLEVMNKGVNGDTTTGILSRFYSDVISQKPDFAFIMAGSNDFLLGRDLFNVTSNIEILIKDCNENNITPIIGIQPFIIGSMAKISWSYYIDYSFVNSLIYTYRENIIKLCSKNNIDYIDFYKSFENIVNKENEEEYFIDGLHPSEKGHKIMVEDFIKKFSSLL